MSNTPFVRIPPDSTGKRIQHRATIIVSYVEGSQEFEIGQIVEGDSSGVTGEVGRIVPSDVTGEGDIYLMLSLNSPLEMDPTEKLRVGQSTYAKVSSSTVILTQNNTIVGGNNTTNAAAVDEKGALYTRTADGSYLFDAFGKLETSERTTIGDYTFAYGKLEEDLQHEEIGGGTTTHDPNSASLVLTCGNSSGDTARTTSHLYHKYQPSVSQVFQSTVAIGDEGKSNVVRKWGYFDEEDGLFFELNESEMNVVLRSSATGTVQETRISQSDWNGDRLTGEGGTLNLSRKVLDVTQLNLWWIDFQWLGAGRIRFGIFLEGQRITIHSISQGGGPLPFTKTATLPVRFCQQNVGTATSSSQMRVVCSTVGCEGDFQPKFIGFSPQFDLPPIDINSFDETPLFSARAKRMLKGTDNRTVILAKELSGTVIGNHPIAVRLYKNAELTDAQWVLDPGPDSGGELDGHATDASGGTLLWSTIMVPGEALNQNLSYLFNYEQGETIKRHADPDNYDTYTLTARLVDPSHDPVKALFTLNWIEIQ